jgi:hypothetical protein
MVKSNEFQGLLHKTNTNLLPSVRPAQLDSPDSSPLPARKNGVNTLFFVVNAAVFCSCLRVETLGGFFQNNHTVAKANFRFVLYFFRSANFESILHAAFAEPFATAARVDINESSWHSAINRMG